MLDTVKGSTRIDGLLRDRFDAAVVSSKADGKRERWIRDGVMRETYFPASGALVVEGSLPKLGGVDPLSNPDKRTELRGLRRATNTLGYPDLWAWRLRRVDYAVNIDVDDVQGVIASLQRITLGRHTPVAHGKTGISWRNSSRWVKFYDKSSEVGELRRKVLRFEVSTFPRGMRALAGWMARDHLYLVDAFDPELEWAVLTYWLRQLGLVAPIKTDNMTALHRVFGQRMATAFLVQKLASEYGTSAFKEHKFISSSTYYQYVKELRENGLLSKNSKEFICVDNSIYIYQQIQEVLLKNLKFDFAEHKKLRKWLPPETSPPKNFSEKFSGLPALAEMRLLYERTLESETRANSGGNYSGHSDDAFEVSAIGDSA